MASTRRVVASMQSMVCIHATRGGIDATRGGIDEIHGLY